MRIHDTRHTEISKKPECRRRAMAGRRRAMAGRRRAMAGRRRAMAGRRRGTAGRNPNNQESSRRVGARSVGRQSKNPYGRRIRRGGQRRRIRVHPRLSASHLRPALAPARGSVKRDPSASQSPPAQSRPRLRLTRDTTAPNRLHSRLAATPGASPGSRDSRSRRRPRTCD